jgi:O-Antigen ligase
VIAQDVLLGRARAIPQQQTSAALGTGGGAARLVLTLILVVVIVFESSTADPLVAFGTFLHRGIGSWTDLPLILTPLELLLILGVIVAVVSAALERRAQDAAKLGWPMVFFLLMVFAGVARGALAGGDMYIGLWEVRYLLYVPACFVIARTSLRRREHVSALVFVGFVAATIFAAEGLYRKLALINTGQLGTAPEFFYEHDDVIFLATFLVLASSAFVFRVQGRLRVLGVVAAPVLLYTLLASNRRSGVIVLLVGLLVVAATLFIVRRRAFFASMLPLLAGTALLLALTWNATGLAGQPARAIRSLYDPDPRDAQSNFYRYLETFNIRVTISEDPILGVGFGREFKMVVPLADLSWWPFWRYETHNNVLWIWLKTGLVGYVAFWILIGTALGHAAFAAKRLLDPGLRLAALFSIAAIVGVVVFGYVDLAFVSGRTTVFLGTVLGIIAVLERVDRSTPPAGAVAAAATGGPLLVNSWRP